MLLADFTINTSQIVHALDHVNEKFEGMLGKFKKFGALAGGSFVGFEILHEIAEGFEKVMETGAHLESLHKATGESVHDLFIFGHALDITGGSAEMAQNFIFKLQNAIAGVNEDSKSTAEALKLFGTSSNELRSMTLLEQVERLQKGLAGIGDQATKVAAVKQLFGFRFAAQALPLLANPEALEHAKQQAEPLAAVFEKNAESFHELEVAIKGLKLNFMEFFAGALQGFAPQATSIADAFAAIDFVGIGEGVGALINVFVTLAQILTPIAQLVNAISHGLAQLGKGALTGGAIGATLGAIAAGPFGAVLGGSLGGLLGNVIGGSGEEGGHGIAEAFRGLGQDGGGDKSPVAALQKIGGGGGFGGADPVLTEARRTNQLLQQVVNNTTPGHGGHAPEHPEV